MSIEGAKHVEWGARPTLDAGSGCIIGKNECGSYYITKYATLVCIH